MSYDSKNSQVLGRQLKVQRLVIPFVITGNATPASKTQVSDEPAILFFKTEGKNDVSSSTGALDSGEASPTFDSTAADATGIFNMLVKISEPIKKVCHAEVISRSAGTLQPVIINSTPLSANGDKILLNCDSAVDLSAANLDACLIVEYVVSE